MKNGYNIHWTDNALKELEHTIEYLINNFTEKEIKKLALEIEYTIALVSQNPNIYPRSDKKGIHKAVILRYNSLYYRVKENNIEILSFFSNRQHPKKRKL